MNILLIFIFSATYTSVTSGLWSNPATWGGSGFPNANGDVVTINSGHTVVYDCDSTELNVTTGFGAITVNGTLRFESNTWIKVAANITGSGYFIVGTPDTLKTNIKIVVNGNYSNQIQNAQYYGADRDSVLAYLVGNYSIGATKIKVDRDLSISAGDVIAIGSSAVQGQTSDNTNPWGRGMYQVVSYNATTDTIEITPALAGNNRNNGDIVAVISREIKIFQATKSASNPRYNNERSSQTYKNCWFHNWGNGVIGGNNLILISCSGSNNTNGGIIYYIYNHILSGIFTASNNVNGGIVNTGSNCTLSGTFIAINNSNGGIAYQGSNNILSGIFISSNNTNGGIIHYGFNHILSGTFITSNNSNGSIIYYGYNHFLSGTFTCSEATAIQYGYCYISGIFMNNKGIDYRTVAFKPSWLQTIWLNYNGAGAHKVYAYGGIIDQVGDTLKFKLEDAGSPLIYEIPVYCENGTIRFAQKVKKSASMDSLPIVELIELGRSDPLRYPNSSALAADTMTNSIDTWEILTIEKSGLTPNKKYYIRLRTRGSSGYVYFAGRKIDEVERQQPYWGYWMRGGQ